MIYCESVLVQALTASLLARKYFSKMCSNFKRLLIFCWLLVECYFVRTEGNDSGEQIRPFRTIVIYNDFVPKTPFPCVPEGNVVGKLKCDGVIQLPEGYDEKSCSSVKTEVPSTNFFTCSNGEKIWDIWKCDGIKHCKDGSDEDNCYQVNTQPRSTLFYICNGVVECRDGHDESNCLLTNNIDTSVTPPFFICDKNGKEAKLTVRFICDGFEDCDNGSDETNCDTKFRCDTENLMLLPANIYCDGLVPCSIRQDKPLCHLNDGPSEHILTNVSDTVRQSFGNLADEIYEYVIDGESTAKHLFYRHEVEEASSSESREIINSEPDLSEEDVIDSAEDNHDVDYDSIASRTSAIRPFSILLLSIFIASIGR